MNIMCVIIKWLYPSEQTHLSPPMLIFYLSQELSKLMYKALIFNLCARRSNINTIFVKKLIISSISTQ